MKKLQVGISLITSRNSLLWTQKKASFFVIFHNIYRNTRFKISPKSYEASQHARGRALYSRWFLNQFKDYYPSNSFLNGSKESSRWKTLQRCFIGAYSKFSNILSTTLESLLESSWENCHSHLHSSFLLHLPNFALHLQLPKLCNSFKFMIQKTTNYCFYFVFLLSSFRKWFVCSNNSSFMKCSTNYSP